MRLKSWNINQRSNFNNFAKIPDFVGDEVLKDDPDVIVITEFYKVPDAYSGTSGRRFRKHPDTKPEVSGHFAG